jgi:murein DD-endopeptidase MepM/ murein hydrolase activator NlpD
LANIENIFVKYIENNDYKSLYKCLTKNFRKSIKKRELKKVIYSYKCINNEYYSMFTKGDIKRYIFLSPDHQQGISITINKNNEIEGLYITKVATESSDKSTELKYYMPIDKKWTVLWGGDNSLVNYHNDFISQRYAFDLLIMKDGESYRNRGENNEDFYAYGQNVLAPQKGVVVDTRSTMIDNPIGETNTDKPSGNYVTIRHKENEYSLIGHFKQGSILVSPGEQVDEATVLGKCGNSGNSYEPHIHFQVMDSPTISNDCTSLKINFVNLENPIQGDCVER